MLPSFETVCLTVLTVLTVSGLWTFWPADGVPEVSEVQATPTVVDLPNPPELSEELGRTVVATGAPIAG